MYKRQGEHTGLVRLCDGNYHGWRAWGEGVLPMERYRAELEAAGYAGPVSLLLPGERYAGRPSWPCLLYTSLPDGSTSKPQQRLELRLIDELSRGQIFLQNHRLDLVIRDLRQTIPPFIHHCRHWHILLILYVIYDRHIEKWLYLQHRWCHYTSIFSRGQGFKVGKNG